MLSTLRTSVTLAGALLVTLGTAASQSQVVINEVAYDAVGSDDGQVFVEIFGPAGTDISGYTIQGIEGRPGSAGTCNAEMFTFPAGTFIDATGLVVVADELGTTGTTLVANADFIVGDMDLENGLDSVQLLDAAGNYVDAVAYGPIDQSVGPMSACNGQTWYEGNPARDVFAPLSIERCPAGSDTDDNAADLIGNLPTPGVAESCCSAIEWVNQGAGNNLVINNGDSVGLDFWFDCAPGSIYLVLCSGTDPSVVPPPPPLPVFDALTTVCASLANIPPYVAWAGVLDGSGSSIGTTFFDFSAFAGSGFSLPSPTPFYIGTIAFDTNLNLVGTNSVVVVLN